MSDLKQVLEAVNSALTVIRTVANTPGVNMLSYASTVASAIGALQVAYESGLSVLPYVLAIKGTFEKPGVPTEAELDALDAKIAALEKQLNDPLPPVEEGKPE